MKSGKIRFIAFLAFAFLAIIGYLLFVFSLGSADPKPWANIGFTIWLIFGPCTVIAAIAINKLQSDSPFLIITILSFATALNITYLLLLSWIVQKIVKK
jgi:hypothetical protein